MVLPLPPRTWQCTRCDWKMTDLSTSDAIIGFMTCPKCDGKVEMRAATSLEIFFAKMGRLFGG